MTERGPGDLVRAGSEVSRRAREQDTKRASQHRARGRRSIVLSRKLGLARNESPEQKRCRGARRPAATLLFAFGEKRRDTVRICADNEPNRRAMSAGKQLRICIRDR